MAMREERLTKRAIGPVTVGFTLILCLPGCMGPSVPMQWPAPAPAEEEIVSTEAVIRVHERRDPESGVLLRRWHTKTGPDGVALLDGRDEGWWPGGLKRHDRSWEFGEEAGQWQSWHSNGALRSTASFDEAQGTMRWWHENGVLAAEGPHRGGTRVGVWTFWHISGGKRSEGAFAHNNREGAWNYWDEDGGLSAAGMYSGGERVGEWFLRPRGTEEAESGSRD